MKTESLISLLQVVAVALLLALVPVVWIFKSSREAAVYNKLTGKEVTTWDAMWVELRIVNE